MVQLIFTQQLARFTPVPQVETMPAGDSWETVSTSMPPVYTVRFA